MEVETEKQGREQAQAGLMCTYLILFDLLGSRMDLSSSPFYCQEAFGKAKDSANSLECQLAAASAMAERLKAESATVGGYSVGYGE